MFTELHDLKVFRGREVLAEEVYEGLFPNFAEAKREMDTLEKAYPRELNWYTATPPYFRKVDDGWEVYHRHVLLGDETKKFSIKGLLSLISHILPHSKNVIYVYYEE